MVLRGLPDWEFAMLAAKYTTDTPLPEAGSIGYLRGTAQKVTVIQRGRDGTCSVKHHQPRFLSPEQRLEWANRGASLTSRVEEADIYPAVRVAMLAGLAPKGRVRSPRRAW